MIESFKNIIAQDQYNRMYVGMHAHMHTSIVCRYAVFLINPIQIGIKEMVVLAYAYFIHYYTNIYYHYHRHYDLYIYLYFVCLL